MKLTGGFTSSRHTYSFGAADVLLPRLVGSAFAVPAGLTPQWNDIVSARPFLLSFGRAELLRDDVAAVIVQDRAEIEPPPVQNLEAGKVGLPAARQSPLGAMRRKLVDVDHPATGSVLHACSHVTWTRRMAPQERPEEHFTASIEQGGHDLRVYCRKRVSSYYC